MLTIKGNDNTEHTEVNTLYIKQMVRKHWYSQWHQWCFICFSGYPGFMSKHKLLPGNTLDTNLVCPDLFYLFLNSPWFVVPGSDMALWRRSRNKQYFPPEHIVDSDNNTGAIRTNAPHRNRSPKWSDEKLSWRGGIVSISSLRRSLGSTSNYCWFFVINQASRIASREDGKTDNITQQPLRTETQTERQQVHFK